MPSKSKPGLLKNLNMARKKPSIIHLDPNGDAILSVKRSDQDVIPGPIDLLCSTVLGIGIIKTQKYLISTTVLRLASPVFARMFQSDFSEGIAVKTEKCPTIELKEDHPDAMDTILRVLHHKSDNASNISPAFFARIAIQADKYQLQKPLKPWAALWCHDRTLERKDAPSDYYLMLMTAWVFRLDSSTIISKKAIENLAPGLIGLPAEIQLPIELPPWVTGINIISSPSAPYITRNMDTDATFIENIHLETSSLRDFLDEQVQFVERRLRVRKVTFNTNERICTGCSDVFSNSGSGCKGAAYRPKLCTDEHRVFEYFSLMSRCELWPPAQYFNVFYYSASKIMNRLPRVEKKLKTHHCDGHDNCPLRKEMEGLVESIRNRFNGVKGLWLPEEKGRKAVDDDDEIIMSTDDDDEIVEVAGEEGDEEVQDDDEDEGEEQ